MSRLEPQPMSSCKGRPCGCASSERARRGSKLCDEGNEREGWDGIAWDRAFTDGLCLNCSEPWNTMHQRSEFRLSWVLRESDPPCLLPDVILVDISPSYEYWHHETGSYRFQS